MSVSPLSLSCSNPHLSALADRALHFKVCLDLVVLGIAFWPTLLCYDAYLCLLHASNGLGWVRNGCDFGHGHFGLVCGDDSLRVGHVIPRASVRPYPRWSLHDTPQLGGKPRRQLARNLW